MSIKPGFALLPGLAALALGGCGPKALELPADPVDRAATCGVITAAGERTRAGVKGELPAEAQARIFHYPLLVASEGGSYDAARAGAVFKRMPELFEQVTKRKWQDEAPACATAFPASAITTPKLPDGNLDAVLQCYEITNFLRKALADQGNAYAEAASKYGAFTTKLDPKVAIALARGGVKGNEAIQVRKKKAIAEAAQAGQPAAFIAACEKRFG
jgi:hypothetical protein